MVKQFITALLFGLASAGMPALADHAASGCIGKLSSPCLLNPGGVVVGREFRDNFDGSSYDPDRCMKRKNDFDAWCGISPIGDSVQFRFIRNGKTIASSVGAPRCIGLLRRTCLNKPHSYPLLVEFHDDFDGSSASVGRCLQRKGDFEAWCGFGPNSRAVSFRFYDGGMLVASTRADD